MLSKKLIEENKEYLDLMAEQILLTVLEHKIPSSFEDTNRVARLSYVQAISMLLCSKSDLIEIYNNNKESSKTNNKS